MTTESTLPYDRAVLVDVLVYHQRRDIGSCGCGWAELGKSHAEHVATIYEESIAAKVQSLTRHRRDRLRPWECSSNSMPDITKACRRRIWLPIFWGGGHCRRCMRRAAAEVGF